MEERRLMLQGVDLEKLTEEEQEMLRTYMDLKLEAASKPSDVTQRARRHAELLGELEVKAGKLRNAEREHKKAQERASETVATARGEGLTWAQIGRIFGISSQAAYQRFDPKGRQKNAERHRTRPKPSGA